MPIMARFPSHDSNSKEANSYRLNGEAAPFVDFASRFQPDGPHGPSQVSDPSVFPRPDQQQPYVLRGRSIAVLHMTRPPDEARSPHGGQPYGGACRGKAASAGLRKE